MKHRYFRVAEQWNPLRVTSKFVTNICNHRKTFGRHCLALLVLLVTMLPQAALATGGTLTGSGTTDDPYLIEDAADLTAFANTFNGGNTSVCAKLMADIDMSGQKWTPIGNSSKNYGGTFDGNAHSVKIKCTGAAYIGFFGWTDGATIKNLIIEGSVSGTSDHVGGIVGYSRNTTITHCLNRADVSGNDNVGGICGYQTSGTSCISSCLNIGTVSGKKTNVGGILGRLWMGDLKGNITLYGKVCGSVPNDGKPTGNYYVAANGGSEQTGCSAIEAAAFSSGEVAYKLNGGETEGAWRQNLSNLSGVAVDEYPVLDETHCYVYLNGEGYYSVYPEVEKVFTFTGIYQISPNIKSPIAEIDLSEGLTNGTAPYTFAFEGDVPSWLQLNASTGVLTGQPTEPAAATTIKVVATDANGKTASISIPIDEILGNGILLTRDGGEAEEYYSLQDAINSITSSDKNVTIKMLRKAGGMTIKTYPSESLTIDLNSLTIGYLGDFWNDSKADLSNTTVTIKNGKIHGEDESRPIAIYADGLNMILDNIQVSHTGSTYSGASVFWISVTAKTSVVLRNNTTLNSDCYLMYNNSSGLSTENVINLYIESGALGTVTQRGNFYMNVYYALPNIPHIEKGTVSITADDAVTFLGTTYVPVSLSGTDSKTFKIIITPEEDAAIAAPPTATFEESALTLTADDDATYGTLGNALTFTFSRDFTAKGNTSYLNTLTLNANIKQKPTISKTSDEDVAKVYDGNAIELSATNGEYFSWSGDGTATVAYYSDAALENEISAPVDCGTYYAKFIVAESDNYLSATTTVAVYIDAKQDGVTYRVNGNDVNPIALDDSGDIIFPTSITLNGSKYDVVFDATKTDGIFANATKICFTSYRAANYSGLEYVVAAIPETVNVEVPLGAVGYNNIPNLAYSRTVGQSGWMTGWAERNVTVPEGGVVYMAKKEKDDEDKDIVGLYKLKGNVIPANTGFVMNAKAGDYSFAVTTDAAAENNESDLTFSADATTTATDEAGYSFYTFAYNSSLNQVAFVKKSGDIAAGLSFLKVSEASAPQSAQAMRVMIINDSATGISTATSFKPQTTDDAIYNIMGQKVTKMEKGHVYIVNGKQFINR